MGYRYIALIRNDRGGGASIANTEATLRKSGLQQRFMAGSVELFTSRETPTLILPDGGILIGYLFSRNGTRISNEAQIPHFSCDEQLRKHLLDNCWGEYLILQTGKQGERALCITREPSGGVPCVYSLQDGAGFITSDISYATSLDLYQKQVDWEYVSRSLTFPHQKNGHTCLTQVNELLPGSTLCLAGARLTVQHDWSPWNFVARECRHVDPGEAAIELRKVVTTAVRAWADTDQSILLEMSGGLDSSIVAACLRDASARVVCCTLVTPVPGTDERNYARLVATQLGVALQTELLDFDSARVDFVLSSSSASPRIGSLQYAINGVMSAAGNRHDVASFFTGAGGDIVFCYLTNAAPAVDAYRERGLTGSISAIRDLVALHQCTLWTAGKLTVKKLVSAPKPPRTPRATFINPSVAESAPENHPWYDAPENAYPGDRERVFGLVDTQVYRDMAPRGIERWLRMPLLAQPVVEASLRIPSWMWIAGGQNRAVARTAFANMLPLEIFNRRSKGNFVSYLGGFYRRNRDRIRDFLFSGQLHDRHLLNNTALSCFLRRDDLPTRDRLFLEVIDLCMVENWLRQQS